MSSATQNPIYSEYVPLVERRQHLAHAISQIGQRGFPEDSVKKDIEYLLSRHCELGEIDGVAEILRTIDERHKRSLVVHARNVVTLSLADRVVSGSMSWVVKVCEEHDLKVSRPAIIRYATQKLNRIAGL